MKDEFVKIRRKHIQEMVTILDSDMSDREKVDAVTEIIVTNYMRPEATITPQQFKVGDVVKIVSRNLYKDAAKEYAVVCIKTRAVKRSDGESINKQIYGLIGVSELVEMDFEHHYTATPHRWFSSEHLRFIRSNPRCIKQPMFMINLLHRKPSTKAPVEGTVFVNMPQKPDGEPCTHPGCVSHQSHPCEECGRTGGVSDAIIEPHGVHGPKIGDID